MDLSDDADLIPWEVSTDHRWAYALSMLRLEGVRRAGRPLSGYESTRLEAWRDNLNEGDLVVHYDARTEDGFTYVLRRAGVDGDLIREPGR